MATSCLGTTCTVPSSATFTMRQRTTWPSGSVTRIWSPSRQPLAHPLPAPTRRPARRPVEARPPVDDHHPLRNHPAKRIGHRVDYAPDERDPAVRAVHLDGDRPAWGETVRAVVRIGGGATSLLYLDATTAGGRASPERARDPLHPVNLASAAQLRGLCALGTGRNEPTRVDETPTCSDEPSPPSPCSSSQAARRHPHRTPRSALPPSGASASPTLTQEQEQIYGPRVELPGGLLLKQPGKVALYGPDQDFETNWRVRLIVDKIAVDPACDRYIPKPERGHRLVISVRAETSAKFDKGSVRCPEVLGLEIH